MLFKSAIFFLFALNANAFHFYGDPYLAFSTFTFNGRGNEGARAGEEVSVGFLVGNVGEGTTAHALITLESVDGPATMVSTSVQTPALDVGESMEVTGMSTGGIRFRVNNNARIMDTITLHLKWKTDEGAEGVVARSLRILQGQVLITLDFGNAAIPEDGGIAMGTTGPAYVNIENTGTEEVTNASFTLTASGCARSVTGQITVPSVQPGEKIRLSSPIQVGIASTCHNGDAASIHFDGNYRTDTGSVPLVANADFPAGVRCVVSGVNVPNPAPAVTDNNETDLEVNVMGACSIQNLYVDLRITHTYIGDLQIFLVHPNGTQITLHDRAGGDTDNLYKRFGFGGDPLPALTQLNGMMSQGVWKLRVLDTANGDVGTVDRFEVGSRGYVQ